MASSTAEARTAPLSASVTTKWSSSGEMPVTVCIKAKSAPKTQA